MSTAVSQTWYMTQRQLMVFTRQPAYAIITLIQPVIWLFLFGNLFKKVVELGGFGTTTYLDYLVPGVVVMSALSSNMWAGMGTLEEIQRGTLNRFLTTPVSRAALMNGNVVNNGLITAFQSVVIVLLALAGGADYPGGIGGIAILVLAAVLLGTVFGALSNALGMLVQERESIIGINTFLLLPLTFLSSAFMAPSQMPPGCGTSPTSTRSTGRWSRAVRRCPSTPTGVTCSAAAGRWWCWRWRRCGCRSGRSGRTSGRCEPSVKRRRLGEVPPLRACRRVSQAAGAAPSCSVSIRAFQSRLEACQPSSSWPSRQ